MGEAIPKLLIEVGWEVCNNVGGTHTVLRTKIPFTSAVVGDDYYLIGPDLDSTCEFEETEEPCWDAAREALLETGISFRLGRWNTEGRPRTILLTIPERDESSVLFDMWEKFGIESHSAGADYVEPVLFGRAAGEAAEALYRSAAERDPVVVCFHEWLSGAGLLYLRKHVPEIGTMFVAHATVLGRALAETGVDIHGTLEDVDVAGSSRRLEVESKHSLEGACAREADCFAAVSSMAARESRRFLGRTPEVLVPGGIDLSLVPDCSTDRDRRERMRSRLLELASGFLGVALDPGSTTVCMSSGRYEFRNKGFDVLIEACGRLNERLRGDPGGRRCVVLMFVLARQTGVAPDAGPPGICTHSLADERDNLLLRAARDASLRNAAGDAVNVILCPVRLDGDDGLLNLRYSDVLCGCDLALFPSQYEPWGYTPLESLAHGVPTLTTDSAGFGRWALETAPPETEGLYVLRGSGRARDEAVSDLTDCLERFVSRDAGDDTSRRRAARDIARRADWRSFHRNYVLGYASAAGAATDRLTGEDGDADAGEHFEKTSFEPHLEAFAAVSELPAELCRMRDLAYNMYWTWNPSVESAFRDLDAEAWKRCGRNPVTLLDTVPRDRLEAMTCDHRYVEVYRNAVSAFDDYMGDTRGRVETPAGISAARPVAFFSMEFGLHPGLPLYAGGLGVLAGDFLRSASDLRFPMVAVGLLYRKGYLSQSIRTDGSQASRNVECDVSRLPLRIATDADGNPVSVDVELEGRKVAADVWGLQVGHVAVYLLDTDTERNSPEDRRIAHHLYTDDRRTRALQEALLGIGGVRALGRLGIVPSVFHMNEGKTAFLLLERLRLMKQEEGLDLPEAEEIVRASSALTIHTTVVAGNETFGESVLSSCLRDYVEKMGIPWDTFWPLGRDEPEETGSFVMTVFGLKLSAIGNAVSRAHAAVTREMWKSVWGGFHAAEAPIISIRNGIHLPTWVGPEASDLLGIHLGEHWKECCASGHVWRRAAEIPDAELWEARVAQKRRLADYIRERTGRSLEPDALTVVWARRFAPYKRATLILSDRERAVRLVRDPDRPVQLIFAGKAHPNDDVGCGLVRRVVEFSRDSECRGRVVFLPDFDLESARQLVWGADLWLNTPTRLMEASGTSGLKAAVNGGLNLSILDGWWEEAFDGLNGWAVGDGSVRGDVADDSGDAESLYDLLETAIVPAFYNRGRSGVPREWLRFVKRSLASIPPVYNTDRMLRDYCSLVYAPAAERAVRLSAHDFALARELAGWKRTIASRFTSARITHVDVSGMDGGTCRAGSDVRFRASVELGKLSPNEVLVEALVFYAEGAQSAERPAEVPMLHQQTLETGQHIFVGTFRAERSGRYTYGVRVLPHNPHMAYKQELGLVSWS